MIGAVAGGTDSDGLPVRKGDRVVPAARRHIDRPVDNADIGASIGANVYQYPGSSYAQGGRWRREHNAPVVSRSADEAEYAGGEGYGSIHDGRLWIIDELIQDNGGVVANLDLRRVLELDDRRSGLRSLDRLAGEDIPC